MNCVASSAPITKISDSSSSSDSSVERSRRPFPTTFQTIIFLLFVAIHFLCTSSVRVNSLEIPYPSRHPSRINPLKMTVTTNRAASSPLKIAVIGAGAAGLAAARVISRSGRPVSLTVLEKDFEVGGIWCYRQQTEDGHNPTINKARPMYRGLRTNLPKEVMQYREFPWILENDDGCCNHPAPSFVTHSQVADYLRNYATKFGLDNYIQYGASVKQLTLLRNDPDVSKVSTSGSAEQWPKIRLEWEIQTPSPLGVTSTQQSVPEEHYSEVFDAVMVCNGHYSQPSSPPIAGLAENFKGKTMHSISYDDPKDFIGQSVLCIGGRASGSDLARELSFHAKEVFLSDTTCSEVTKVVDSDNDTQVTWVPKTVAVRKDGSVQFDNECPLHPIPDTIIFCSGYDYSFPFLNEKSNIELQVVPGERRVSPLYKQLWHAKFPNLALVGLPHSVVPFPLMEFQSEAVWAQWQKCTLPNVEERLREARADANSGGAANKGRVVDTHFLGDAQWDYCREMARFAGLYDSKKTAESTEAYIRMNRALYDYAGQARKSVLPGGPDTYRSLIFTRDQSQTKFDVVDPLASDVNPSDEDGTSSREPVNKTVSIAS
ncbi:dimethylaniline monooxygenase [Nitzschia inconspicua]|uniref:Dimethylaniline monooxygenase n=1 Tax=Nitzschia inconspicua TaxID=303405 RepID=A0A9K3PXS0_9STRA|nr:dimethylaniline monooxygenase [Nitzschia inconspicua]